MSTAQELLAEFFDCLRSLSTSVDRCVDLFADDGAFEFPYMSSLGINTRFEGKAGVREVLDLIRSHYPSFTVSNIAIHEMKDGRGLFAEYHAECPIAGSTRVYAQDYASRLLEENGKIKLLREYLNAISAARALLPNGLADVPEPKP